MSFRGMTYYCVLVSNNARGQETPVGERRRASSPERRGQRQTRFASTGEEGITLGISWVGWQCTAPKAPLGQQRRGCSDRTSEQSRHLVGPRVVWEAKRDEKLGFATALGFF